MKQSARLVNYYNSKEPISLRQRIFLISSVALLVVFTVFLLVMKSISTEYADFSIEGEYSHVYYKNYQTDLKGNASIASAYVGKLSVKQEGDQYQICIASYTTNDYGYSGGETSEVPGEEEKVPGTEEVTYAGTEKVADAGTNADANNKKSLTVEELAQEKDIPYASGYTEYREVLYEVPVASLNQNCLKIERNNAENYGDAFNQICLEFRFVPSGVLYSLYYQHEFLSDPNMIESIFFQKDSYHAYSGQTTLWMFLMIVFLLVCFLMAIVGVFVLNRRLHMLQLLVFALILVIVMGVSTSFDVSYGTYYAQLTPENWGKDSSKLADSRLILWPEDDRVVIVADTTLYDHYSEANNLSAWCAVEGLDLSGSREIQSYFSDNTQGYVSDFSQQFSFYRNYTSATLQKEPGGVRVVMSTGEASTDSKMLEVHYRNIHSLYPFCRNWSYAALILMGVFACLILFRQLRYRMVKGTTPAGLEILGSYTIVGICYLHSAYEDMREYYSSQRKHSLVDLSYDTFTLEDETIFPVTYRRMENLKLPKELGRELRIYRYFAVFEENQTSYEYALCVGRKGLYMAVFLREELFIVYQLRSNDIHPDIEAVVSCMPPSKGGEASGQGMNSKENGGAYV